MADVAALADDRFVQRVPVDFDLLEAEGLDERVELCAAFVDDFRAAGFAACAAFAAPETPLGAEGGALRAPVFLAG